MDTTHRPIHVMAKAAGASCNMRCDYCYYLDKERLYRGAERTQPTTMMPEEYLEHYIRQYIQAQPEGVPVTFTWHGGEALLRPLSFYQRALELQEKYGQGRLIENTLQTNGLLLSPAWCRFFREHEWLIGISLDGMKEMHDRYRRTVSGLPTFERVMRGVKLLQDHAVEFNILATVNRYNAEEPLAFYHFLKSIGNPYIQFAPIVERLRTGAERHAFVEAPFITEHPEGRLLHDGADVSMAPYSILPEQWGYFTTTIFDEWVRTDVGRVFIQLFDATLATWMGVPPGVCLFLPECGHAAALEHNGDLYSCDHFVYPRYRLGNVAETPLRELMDRPEQITFGKAKRQGLTEQCKECEFLFACWGECPKNRFAYSSTGEPGHNYLCRGYYQFWSHVAPYMDYMKACLMQGLPPAQVMHWVASQD